MKPSPLKFAIAAGIVAGIVYAVPLCGCAEYSFPERDGPEFAVAFPDPSVLVHTTDPDGLRRVLDRTPLPDDPAHHAMLLGLLEDVDSLDTEHLLLLTQAVALPLRMGEEPSDLAISSVYVNGKQVIVATRGEGEWAPVVDELLLTGADKLTDPGATAFGRLINTTQSDEALTALTAKLDGPGWDDGSPEALDEILEEIDFNSVRTALCVKGLIPAGRLSADRVQTALEHADFDSDRLELLTAHYAGREQIGFDELLRHVRHMSFDDGRIQVVGLAADLIDSMNGQEFAQVVEASSFDSGRVQIVTTLAPKIRISTTGDAIGVLEHASFDSARKDMLEQLVERADQFDVDGDGILALVKLTSFDSTKADILRLVAPRLRVNLTPDEAGRLMRAFSFDSGRSEALEILRDRIAPIEDAGRKKVLAPFSFDSSREKAREMLGWY